MTRLALLGAALVVAATVAVAVRVGADDGPGVADTSRLLLGVVLFLTPGAIGLAGAWRREPTLLVAAGILCLLQAVVAFSGVTIVYLPAALTFLLASTYGEAVQPTPARWSVGGAVAAAVVGVLIAMLVIRITGIYGVLLVVVAGGVARLLTSPRQPRARVPAASALLGVLVVALAIGGWLVAAAGTREVCWLERTTPTGNVRENIAPEEAARMSHGADIVASGCDTGVPTTEGTALSLAFAGLAIASALLVPPRSRPPMAAAT